MELTMTYLVRSGHSSAYDKNVEDELHASAVPDEVIKPDSDKYWSPHPKTGVFGPSTTEHSATAEGAHQDTAVLEETAWFRPTSLEDSDKTHHV
ncbi:putative Late embryogenesis abundant protein [Arabidopsis thaliana]